MKTFLKKIFLVTFCILAFLFIAPTNVHAYPQTPGAISNLNISFDAQSTEARITWQYDNTNPHADGFIVKRFYEYDNSWCNIVATIDANSTNSYKVIDSNIQPGTKYYYEIAAFIYVPDSIYFDDMMYGPDVRSELIQVPFATPVIYKITPGNKNSLVVSWSEIKNAEGYYIYRSTNPNTGYQLVGNRNTKNSYYGCYDSLNYPVSSILDNNKLIHYCDENLTAGQRYYYKVCCYYDSSTFDSYVTGPLSAALSEIARLNAPTIKKAVSKKKSTNTITWKKVSGADGYTIYYSKKFDGKYKKLKTVKTGKKLTYTHKKLKNGVQYFYKIYSYKKINGKNLFSCEPEILEKYCDYYTYDDEDWDSRYKRIFGNKDIYKYKNQKQANKYMKTVKIKVWDINSKGKKFAPSVKKMFSEIYKSKEKFPIHDIGAFSWRGNNSTSEHCLGTAFDINPNENYMIDNGKILSGSFWKPKKNPYSIPNNSKIVKILRKYGFYRGIWGSRRDYMHFSYFGT